MRYCLMLLTVFILSGCLTNPNVRTQPQPNIISVSEQSNRTINFASQELSKYLKAMTDSDYPVVCEAKAGDASLVRFEIDKSLHHDGYRLSRKRHTIFIAGGSPRGCLYGVYTFLHELGCRWPLPGKEYEVIPHLKAISWAGPDIESKPAVGGRGIVLSIYSYNIGDIIEMLDFMAKNRFNFIYILPGGSMSPNYAVPLDILPAIKQALTERDMGFEWGTHLLPGYLPRSLFDEHPEYFRMDKYKRTAKYNMCPSSPEAADIIANNSLKDWSHLREIPRFEALHLYPDDLVVGGWCACEKCADLTESDQALKIINEVAKRLPLGQSKLTHAAYHATVRAPENIKPHDNVQLLYAPRERCYKHPLDQCKTNQWYLEHLKQQVRHFPNCPAVFEYYLDMILFRDLPMPLHPIIGEDVRVYRQAGIDRIDSLSFQLFSNWAYGPNYYVFGKALWRGQGNPNDIEEYCAGVYGPSGQAMKQYFDLLFELCATAMQTCGYDGFPDMRTPPYQPWTKTHVAQLAPFVTDAHLEQIESVIKQAMMTAQEPYKTRIENQMILWRVARLEVPAIYNSMLAAYKVEDVLKGSATPADRLYTIAIIKQAIENIDAATEILTSAPQHLRSDNIYRGPGCCQGRLRKWLEKLE